MPQGRPVPGEFYRHFKGKLYQIVTIAKHSETREKMVVYQAMYGDYGACVRPYDMFISEVDHLKYPEVQQKWRFEYLESPEQFAAAATPAAAPKEAEPPEPPAEEAADPRLIRYMDAESFSAKFEVFIELRSQMTHKLLDELAVVSDLVIPEGDLQERYDQMKKCLLTRMKYERERKWGE